MTVFVLLAALVAEDVSRLRAEDWADREAATARLDDPVLSLFLPGFDPDPEANHRLQWLATKGRNARSPAHGERVLFLNDFERWVTDVFKPGYSVLDTDEVFRRLFDDRPRVAILMKHVPSHESGGNETFLHRPPYCTDLPRWNRYLHHHFGNLAPVPHVPRER